MSSYVLSASTSGCYLPVSCRKFCNKSSRHSLVALRFSIAHFSSFGRRIPIWPAGSRRFISIRPSSSATLQLTLPTAKPERAKPENLPKWSSRAIKSFSMAELEARKLKFPNTGTEALLMGILVEGTNDAAKFLRSNGITLFKSREKAVEIVGKSYIFFFSPEHPPLTEPAQKALDWAVDEKIKTGEAGEITTTHLLLAIWGEAESAGHKIMAALGFNDEKAKELANSLGIPHSSSVS